MECYRFRFYEEIKTISENTDLPLPDEADEK